MRIMGESLPRFLVRIVLGVVQTGVSLVIWLYVPTLVFQGLGRFAELAPTITGLAIFIAGMTALGSIFRGHPIQYALGAGSGLTQATFLLLVTNGGSFMVTLEDVGISVTLEFRLLLYILMMPSLVSVARNLWMAVHASSARPFTTIEIIE